MKENFALYVPAEGMIEEGDIVDIYVDVGEEPYEHTFDRVIGYNPEDDTLEFEGYTVGRGYCTKVELFLCSRDIKVGDKYLTAPDYDIERTCEDESYNFEHCLKKIARVSPNATWVKFGMKFAEEDWVLGNLWFNFHNNIWTDKDFAGKHHSRPKQFALFRDPSSNSFR